jgi:hypothetical protein
MGANATIYTAPGIAVKTKHLKTGRVAVLFNPIIYEPTG